MKILFTGVSSFTGHWFACELAAAGHEVSCALTGSQSSYEGIRVARMRELPSSVRVKENAAFGTEGFLTLIREAAPDVLCHHGADVRNYRSADFDPFSAVKSNSLNIAETLKTFASSGGKAVVLTGSVFEAGEGQGETPLRAFSPYGLSKALTSGVFEYYAPAAGLSFGKFVIPNPFGPKEDPRFTGYLMKTWKAGQAAGVKTPDYIRDNIPVDLLARCYRAFVESMPRSVAGSSSFCRPSGFVESQGAFAQRVAREVAKRTGWDCKLELGLQTDFSEPRVRFNPSPMLGGIAEWSETSFWDQFARFYSA